MAPHRYPIAGAEWRRMGAVVFRRRRRGLAVAAGLIFIPAGPVTAQEALFLRIKPQPDPASLGAAGGAQAALSAREAVWERSNARARTIIESVCTGCLRPWTTPAGPLPPRLVTTAAAVAEGTAAAGPLPDLPAPKIPAPPGVESDPPPGASEPTFDPSFPERRP